MKVAGNRVPAQRVSTHNVSLPALMQLMGHADIQTTLLYVRVTPQDVYLQYARAVAQRTRPLPVTAP